MRVVKNGELETAELPGLLHRTIGGREQGVKTMEVWMQTMTPGSATPVHCHACEEVIVVLSGSGECIAGGEKHEFGPNSTLVVEPDLVHQLVNTSDEDMKLIAVFGMNPVRVKTAEGEPLPLPWDTPE